MLEDMGGRKRSIVIDPTSLRRTLNEAIRGFCHDVLVRHELIAPEVLEDPTLIAAKERIVVAVARRWQDWEADFEPDDPPTAQALLESGALAPAVIEAIDRICREVLIPAGHIAQADWDSHHLDSHKYSIARRVSRGWVSDASAL